MSKEDNAQITDEEDFFSDEQIEKIEEMELSEEQLEDLMELLKAEKGELFSAYTDHIKKCMGTGKTMKECATSYKAPKGEKKEDAEDGDEPGEDKAKDCPEGQTWDEASGKCVPKPKEEEKASLTASWDAFEKIEFAENGVILYPKGELNTKAFAELDASKGAISLDVLVKGTEEDVMNSKLKAELETLKKEVAEQKAKMEKFEKPKRKSENFSKGKKGQEPDFAHAVLALAEQR